MSHYTVMLTCSSSAKVKVEHALVCRRGASVNLLLSSCIASLKLAPFRCTGLELAR